jgi:hypothetical protein
MSDLADKIKEISHLVSEDYLLNQISMNNSIFLKASNEQFNTEIVKRICELANQNVYLSLFNDPNVNKANIQFELADYNKILDKLQKSEQDMKEYKIVPKGFKTQLAFDRAKKEAIEQSDFQQKKLAEFDELQYGKSKFQHLLNSLETLKIASEEDTKEAFSKMFNDSKLLVAQGDSIADLAKIAMRHVKDEGFEMMKIAKAYNLIATELKDNGYTVNEELTKISELAINKESKILNPALDYMLGLEKISALNEMCNNVKILIDLLDKTIEKTAALPEFTTKSINTLKQIPGKVTNYLKTKGKDLAVNQGVGVALDVGIGGTSGAIAARAHKKQDKK